MINNRKAGDFMALKVNELIPTQPAEAPQPVERRTAALNLHWQAILRKRSYKKN